MVVSSISWPLRVLAIKEQVEPEALIDLLGFDLQSGGQMSCPNPDHPDRHPSARFYSSGQFADGGKVHCFTCAKTWDMVGLVQLVHGLSFPDAVAWLEDQFLVQTGDDVTMVAATLRRRGASDCTGLTALVETTVHAARPHCTIEQYAKLWRAYDVACHGFATRKLDEATFVAALDRVLALTPPAEAHAR